MPNLEWKCGLRYAFSRREADGEILLTKEIDMRLNRTAKYNRQALAFFLTATLAVYVSYGTLVFAESNPIKHEEKSRPNFIVIMVDDMGYSDLGCYGAEVIATPELDQIASQGLKFRNFMNTAKCGQSRASLLSGLWWGQAGSRTLKHAVTFGQALKRSGYKTGVVGKWDSVPHPLDCGFDRFFGFLRGADVYVGGSIKWQYDREPFNEFGRTADEFYATDAFTDYAIRFINEWEKEDDTPFALYLPYNAPHSPLQAPEALVKKYRGKFMQGWEANQRKRYQNQLKLGVIKSGTMLPEWPQHHRKWDETSDLDKSWEDYRRAIYAAMIESLDTNIGRLKDELVKLREWDNTVLLFCSDNGGDSRNINKKPYGLPWEARYHVQVGTEWAGVSNTPFRWYKMEQHRGGVSTPLIISWPRGLKANGWSDFRGHLVDVYPTLLDLAGVSYPEQFNGNPTLPLVGVSMRPVLEGREYARNKPIYLYYATNKGIVDGNMKLVSVRSGPWELYDLEKDPTELNDLASKYPEKVKELIAKWMIEARKDGKSEGSAIVTDKIIPFGTRSWPAGKLKVGDPNPAEQPPVWEKPPALGY